MQDQHRSQRISVADAAARIGLDPSRVRALAKSGQLPAEKIANRWLIDAGSLDRRIGRSQVGGRPFEPRKAWALLFLFSSEDAAWLSIVDRSKLRAVVRDREFESVSPRLGRRAEVRFFAGGERARNDIVRASDFVRSGLSAAEHYGASLRSGIVVDGYLPRRSADRLIYRHALREVDEREAEIVLRLADFWPLGGRNVAPKAAVVADLLDSHDERTARAGRELGRRLRAR